MRLARIRYRDRVLYARPVEGGFLLDAEDREALIPEGEAEILPVSQPTKVVGIGWNFPKHIEEMQGRLRDRGVEERPEEPIVFLKPPSCLIADGDPIVIPQEAQRVEYEGELTAVMGRRCRRVEADRALAYVAGWTCGNDVTEREFQSADKQWWRAKGYDTFGPVGRLLETDVPEPDASIRTLVNGEVRQEGRVRDMLFDPATIISFVSRAMTLEEGDLIMLGTPPGVGPLSPGDGVEVRIDGIGTLRNPVVAEQA